MKSVTYFDTSFKNLRFRVDSIIPNSTLHMEVYMFDINVKDQVQLLNHKTFSLENELKDLEEKIRIGQNRLHELQRQLRREILFGEEGTPKKISYLENTLTTAIHRISILEEILDGQFDEEELSIRMDERVISDQYRDDIKGYFIAMVNHFKNLEDRQLISNSDPKDFKKLLSELNKGMEVLRNGLPLDKKFEILMNDKGASFKVGNIKGEINVKVLGAPFELKTKTIGKSENSKYEYFRIREMLQAVARIFAFEMSRKSKNKNNSKI